MKLWLKCFILIYSFLIALILIGSGLTFRDSLTNQKVFAFCAAGSTFLMCSVSGFLSQRTPQILRLPIILFAIYGLAEIAFIGSGVMSDTDNSVPVWHWSILVFLRIIIPFALSWSCLRIYKRLNNII